MKKNQKKIIAPSILSADFGKLAEEIKEVQDAGADWIHCDVMDGVFVPNITIGPVIVKAARKATKLPLDVHLMIIDPDRYLEDFRRAGADVITVHQEACPHLHRTLTKIKELGAKAGVSINPSTPISALNEVFGVADLILVMTVNPGFGGQKFIDKCREKISDLRDLKKKHGYKFIIEVDGGVSEKNIKDLSNLGAEAFVAGSAIFGSDSYEKIIAKMRKEVTK